MLSESPLITSNHYIRWAHLRSKPLSSSLISLWRLYSLLAPREHKENIGGKWDDREKEIGQMASFYNKNLGHQTIKIIWKSFLCGQRYMQILKNLHSKKVNGHTRTKLTFKVVSSQLFPICTLQKVGLMSPEADSMSSIAYQKPGNIHSGCACHPDTQASSMHPAPLWSMLDGDKERHEREQV